MIYEAGKRAQTKHLSNSLSRTVAYCRLFQLTNLVSPHHDSFHFDWQELLLGIKACYYLSCPVRQGLTGVTFSLVQQGAGIHYPVSSELASGSDCCLSTEALCPVSFLLYTCMHKWKQAGTETPSCSPVAVCTYMNSLCLSFYM